MSQDRLKKLHALTTKLKARFGGTLAAARNAPPEADGPVGHDPVLREFVRSFLAWECTLPRAEAALRRVDEACVDLNEFRVCLADEMAVVFGSTYPRGSERALRLKQALHGLYRHEHALRLVHLCDRGKRESRAFLESLGRQPPVNGAGQAADYQVVPPYVSARVMLVALGGHAFPLDERLQAMLTQAGVLEPGSTIEEATAWLERSLRAGELAECYQLVQAWSDDAATPVVKSRKVPAKRAPVAKRRSRPAGVKRTPVPPREKRAAATGTHPSRPPKGAR